jgi:PLAT/LH2 domain-containing protein
MPPKSDPFGPIPSGLSQLQRELELRRRCYQEKILRGLYVVRLGYDLAWKNQHGAQYGWNSTTNSYDGVAEEQGPSVCEILGFKKPSQIRCSEVSRHPIIPAKPGEALYWGLARLEIVARQPERQKEIFGWVTPAKHDFVGQTAFTIAKAKYWTGPSTPIATSVGEALQEVYSLQDTADFHANYLLRLLYLYGNTPVHLRTHKSSWRKISRFGRDINFSAQVETTIRNNLLAFKYWIDEPFFADDAGGVNLRRWRRDKVVREKALKKAQKQASGVPFESSDDSTEKEKDVENDDYKTEMTFWSENHQILFATAEYLAGQLWPDVIFRVGNHFRVEGPEKTRPSDLIGRQHMDKAKPRILRWLNDRLRFGFSEWNSPGYYDEDFTALFNLADFCLDDEIQNRACMVLDLMIFDLARFTHRGSFAVTSGRCYFEHKNCGYGQATGDLVELLFGTRDGVIVEPSSTAAGAFAFSRRYQVPEVLIAIGQDKPKDFVDRSRVSINFEDAGDYDIGFTSDEDVMFWWSRGAFFVKWVIPATRKRVDTYHLGKSSPFKDIFSKLDIVVALAAGKTGTLLEIIKPTLNPVGTIIEIAKPKEEKTAAALTKLADDASVLTEGSALTRANRYTYRSPHAMLSSVQNFRAGQLNFQSQVCQATLSMGATVWTTYPSAGDAFGVFKAGGHDGPNWWTGNATTPRVLQFRNAAIVAYKPRDIQFLLFGHRTHAWFPKEAFDSESVIQRGANCNKDGGVWTFGRVGDGYVGLFSAQTPHWTTNGPWTDKELIADGTRNIFIFQVGNAAEFGSYDKFVDSVSGARIHIGGLHLVTAGEVAGAAAAGGVGAVIGFEVAGPLGALVGGIGAAFFGAKHTSEDFECSYDIPRGDRLELHYDKNEVYYAGGPLCDDSFPRFENPYIKCGRVEWDRYLYTIKHGDHSLTHDFREIANNVKKPRVRRSLDENECDCESGPRPFYIVGHNPNTIADVRAALDAGANAIEPDVNVYEDRQGELCISETGKLDTDEGGDSDAPPLIQYLSELHDLAMKRPELALVVFDCKPKVATAVLGMTLLKAIRKHFTDDTKVNVIISVSSLSEWAIFETIRNELGPREGVMVDEENDPDAVSTFFTGRKIDNQCYANGSAFQSPTLSPHLRPSLDRACALRARAGKLKFIYTWTLDDADMMREYIRIGVDGIIPGKNPSKFDAEVIPQLRAITRECQFQSLIRIANRDDNPFQQPNAAYALSIHTGDVWNAGTDANLAFTLKGKLGSARKTVDTSLIGSIFGKTPGRMERDAWDYVTLPSPDLGELLSITVQRDDAGHNPGWFLDKIIVESAHYGVSKQANFNCWIDTAPVVQVL